eukprot:m.6167 g.6167  ORF g.6167 m.6167 type:complete len:285 (-) comp4003_c0_seq2:49-903(-)
MVVRSTTHALRGAAILSLVVLHLFQDPANGFIQRAWSWLRMQWWFQHDSFEPILSTLWFFPCLALWFTCDLYLPSLHKYRLQPHRTDTSHWKVVANPASGRSHMPTLFFYLAPLVAFDLVFPRRQLPVLAPTAPTLLLEIVAMLLVYDLLFFVCHWSMHHLPGVYPRVHAKHHEKTVTRANDAVRLTLVEEFFDVGCSVVAVNVVGAHPLSRALYDMLIVYLLVELHCGYDMPWMWHNVVPAGLMGGPPRHDRHHMDGRFYFQKFFTYIDNTLGFVPLPPKVKT